MSATARRVRDLAAPTAALVLVCAVAGYAAARDPLPAAIGAGVLVTLALAAMAGIERLTTIVVAAIPWLVLLIDLTPTLTLTVTSAIATLLLLLQARVSGETVPMFTWLAVWLFVVAVVIQIAQSATGAQLQEAAKYALFPAMALVVASPVGRARLVTMRPTLIASGVAAMVVDGAAIVLHIGRIGSYYGVGEQLGLTATSPHEIALIGVIVAIACLATVRDIRWRIFGAVVSVIPALASGVRSPLVALVISLLVLMARARFRPSVLVAVGVIAAAVIFSGVGSIIADRYARSQTSGEFSSVASAGSGRGGLWETSVSAWSTSGPNSVVFGDGLLAVERITTERLQGTYSVQSDLIGMVVELGIFGVVAWVMVWLSILRSKVNWLILLPIMSYAVTNGALQYVGAVVFGISLAAACGTTAAGPAWRRQWHPH